MWTVLTTVDYYGQETGPDNSWMVIAFFASFFVLACIPKKKAEWRAVRSFGPGRKATLIILPMITVGLFAVGAVVGGITAGLLFTLAVLILFGWIGVLLWHAPIPVRAVRVRERISPTVRGIVWRRDGGQCVICGSTEKLEFGHIIPWSKGGSDGEENLQIECQYHNRSKGNRI